MDVRPTTDARQFALQHAAHFGTVSDVRMIVASMTLLAGASTAFAQEQEGKLIDRLLKPNMSLANPAQNKQFAVKGASVDQRVRTKLFSAPEGSPTKPFGRTRVLSPGEFAARHFRTGVSTREQKGGLETAVPCFSTANFSTRSQLAKADTVQVESNASSSRVAPESGNNVATAPFADNRPFLGQGKSQKALRAHDQPLTIEQVRELLNKNK